MSSNSVRQVLFIQLPRLDNDVTGPAENAPLAAAYLRHAVKRSSERRFWSMTGLQAKVDRLDDRHLVGMIVRARPSVVAATLYLWNVERTLHVLKLVKKALPWVRVIAGGPEVARGHPFLFRRGGPIDVAVTGEGEAVFPLILLALRRGGRTDFKTVAWRVGRRFTWGLREAPTVELGRILPPAGSPANRPDGRGMGYVETSRGCAWSCAFCCYNQGRTKVTWLPAADVIRRVKALKRRGAREIRFIDPTFNSNPDFAAIVRGLARMNRNKALSFFAELRPELLARADCALLAAANFGDVEVGIQSRDPRVLAAVARQADVKAAERGVMLLSRAGIRTTVDIMCGLPEQTPADIRNSLRWAVRVKKGRVQFLHTLLLPGTELRNRRRMLGLDALARPPYRVFRTPSLSAEDILAAERFARRLAGGGMDCPAVRLVGRRLPDMFPEVVRLDARRLPSGSLPGYENRRALLVRGKDLFGRRAAIRAVIRRALAEEPHILWQFALAPAAEEPLDLLDCLVRETLRVPAHFLDSMTVTGEPGQRVARRVFVLLQKHGCHSRSWIQAAENLLSRYYC